MSFVPVLKIDEKVAYLNGLNAEAFERDVIDDVILEISLNTKERKSGPDRYYTKAQMLRHRRAVDAAANNMCIRQHTMWKEYLASDVGRYLEKMRVNRHYYSDDKDLWTEESKEFLRRARRTMEAYETTLNSSILLLVLLVIGLVTWYFVLLSY